MERFEFRKIDNGFFSIEQDGVRSFMLLDDKYVLLIDSGRGGNNLFRQVREHSHLPVKMIYTHADVDHTGDADDFPIRFMHPSEFDYYESKNEAPVTMQPIWEGDKVTVGDYHFEVVLIPGHTPGSIALLDRKHRIMIGGDSLQPGPIYMFGPGRNFNAYHASMLKMQEMIKDIDWIYPSHHDLRVPATIVNQLLAGAEKMLAGEVEGEPVERFNGRAKVYHTDGVAFLAK